MDRRTAIAKATVDTTAAAGGLLNPEQSSAFLEVMKEKTELSKRIRIERRVAPTGEINKLSTNARVIRLAKENDDDGYRAGAQFPTVDYVAKKVRLPFEITEDALHENIEG
jgi:HK97 family phage major capsid protein